MDFDIKLDSFNKAFVVGENISGIVNVTYSEKVMDFNHINIVLNGSYTIKNNKSQPPTVSLIKFVFKKQKIAEFGQIHHGSNNNFQFKMALAEDEKGVAYYETYQGVIVSIGYELSTEVISSKGVAYNSEVKKITVSVPGQGIREELKRKVVPYEFTISPTSLEKVKISQSKIPKFHIYCRVENTNCDMNNYFFGYVNIKECDIPIKSIECQLVRNEVVFLSNGESISEVSEIQNLQVGDGDVIRGIDIPLYMIFPRFFSCASLSTKIAKINFEVNLIVVLINGFVITENVPLNTWRS